MKRLSTTSALGLILSIFATFISLPNLSQAALSTVPTDATVARGQSVLFSCEPGDINTDKGVEWTAQYVNPQKFQKLFTVTQGRQPDISYVEGVDQNKYRRDGTYNLKVNDIQLTEAAAYGCSALTGNPQYANLIVIGDLSISISPSSNLNVGSQITITCTLTFAGPNATNVVKSLDSRQDPSLTITAAGRDLNAVVYRQNNTSQYLSKIAVVNTTVTQDFVGADVTCQVTSTTDRGMYSDKRTTYVNIPSPAREVGLAPISTGRSNSSYNGTSTGSNPDFNDLRQGDSVNCTAKGTPLPTVKWQAVTPGLNNPALPNWGPGWAQLTFDTARDNQEWNCTATNNASVPVQAFHVYKFNVKTITGQSVTGGASASRINFALVLLSFITLLLKNIDLRIISA